MQRAKAIGLHLTITAVFALPLFHSSHHVVIARLRNFGLLLFNPVVLHARFLQEIVPCPAKMKWTFAW